MGFGEVAADAFADFERALFMEDVVSGDRGGAGGGGHVAGEHADGGGFSGAVGSEETDDDSFGDFERDVIDGEEIAVALGELIHHDICRLAHAVLLHALE